MIYEHFLLITFLSAPELIFFFLDSFKWFQVLLSNTNNSIRYSSLVCTQ